jgi:hypothetical protein
MLDNVKGLLLYSSHNLCTAILCCEINMFHTSHMYICKMILMENFMTQV